MAMQWSKRFGLTALLVAFGLPAAHAQLAGERLRELFESLDANADQVIERAEVPEKGLAAFDRLLERGDKNKDGRLDAEEMQGLGEMMRRAVAPLAERANRPAMDANQDGKISREEFRGPAQMFDRLDTNRDGQLVREELRAGFPPFTPRGPGMPGPGDRTPIAAMDQNNDGKIARDEFRGPAQMFDRLDKDGDGLISAEELRAMRPAGMPPARPMRPGQPGVGRGATRGGLGMFDANADGTITREEFKGPQAMFERMDGNKDGVIDATEFTGFRQRPAAAGDRKPGRPTPRKRAA